MGTEIEGRTSKILCTVLEFPKSEILNSCLGWDDNFNSHWREKSHSCCTVMMSQARSLRHICDFSRVEASYKKSYYLYTSVAE